MTRTTNFRSAITLSFIFTLAVWLSAPAQLKAQAPRGPAFTAQHYDISATLDPAGQSLSAIAKVDFIANEVSGGIRVELNQNLDLKDVKTVDGKTLNFERDSGNTLVVTVFLSQAVATGTKISLIFDYAGLLANQDNSPVPGLRTAVISKEGTYLLLPARWFPLTNYPANRYSATFHLNVPDNIAVAGTGKSSAPTPLAGGRLLYTFEGATPEPYGTFVAGELKLSAEQAEGINVSVYAPANSLGKPSDFAGDPTSKINFVLPLQAIAGMTEPKHGFTTVVHLIIHGRDKALRIMFPRPCRDDGELVLRAHINARPGDHLLEGVLRYQACDTNSCYPPRKAPVAIDVIAR